MASKFTRLMKDVESAIRSFDNDPADSSHQLGYLSALEEVKSMGQHIIAHDRIENKILENMKANNPSLYYQLVTEAQLALTNTRS